RLKEARPEATRPGTRGARRARAADDDAPGPPPCPSGRPVRDLLLGADVERIKRVRKVRGVSLTMLADRTGLFREAIAYAERRGTDPRASTLARLARGLGVPVCRFFDQEDS